MQTNAATAAPPLPRHTLRSPSDEAELFSQQPKQPPGCAEGEKPPQHAGDAHSIAPADSRTQLARVSEQPLKTAFADTFTLGPLLGKGAYAPVHLAVHRGTGKSLAVKIYEGFRQLERDRRALITREVQIMRKLHHENIVKYGGMFNEATALYIVMQHLSGGSLHGMVRSHPKGKLPESAAKKLFYDVVKGVNYLHSQSIVHRDLKLENMLLDEKGRVRLIDFGFATLLKPGVKCRMACGTPSYMPPEILKKGEYEGTAADMWSLGVVLYAMLHGCYPFRAQQPKELYQKISAGEFSLAQTLSAEAKLLLQGLLTLNPEDRLTAQQTLVHPWLQAVAEGAAGSGENGQNRRGRGGGTGASTSAAQRTSSSLHFGLRGNTAEELQALAAAAPAPAPVGQTLPAAAAKPFSRNANSRLENPTSIQHQQQQHPSHGRLGAANAKAKNAGGGENAAASLHPNRREEDGGKAQQPLEAPRGSEDPRLGDNTANAPPSRGSAATQHQPYSRLLTRVKEFFASPSRGTGGARASAAPSREATAGGVSSQPQPQNQQASLRGANAKP